MVAMLKPGVDVVRATKMEDHDQNDWTIVAAAFKAQNADLADRVLAELARVKRYTFGYQVDRYTHCLQTATRALRAGADEETVVCALLHDIGDDVAPYTHGDYAAAILKPFVSDENHWMIQNHRCFQGYHFFHLMGQDRFAREHFRGHPAFERTCRLCDEWDQTAFDPNYDTMPIAAFAPMVRRLFSRAPNKRS